MSRRIYLDNNASTAVDPRVAKAVMGALEAESEGNPSSIHSSGQKARYKLTEARQKIASYFDVRPHEVIFTSGGTEGVNMLLHGRFPGIPIGHLITSNVEHSSVFSTAKRMEANGLRCTFLEVGSYGAPRPESVAQALRPETSLIMLMGVNNETGVKTDIDGIAAIAQQAKVPFFVDGVAMLGKELFTVPAGVTGMAFSGHKIHAPKGIGFIVIRSHQKLSPLFLGGDQEYGRRAGTENLPGIVGLAAAIDLLYAELPEASKKMALLRDEMEKTLFQKLSGVHINGLGPRTVNTSNLVFDGVEGEMLLAALDLEGIAVSHGSACASGALEPSRILLQMGCSKEQAASSIRISLSRFTTEEEIEHCVKTIIKIVNKQR